MEFLFQVLPLLTTVIEAGTVILSKHEPLTVTKTLPGHPDGAAVKGRLVTLEFEKFYLVGTYVTNAGQDLKVNTFCLLF